MHKKLKLMGVTSVFIIAACAGATYSYLTAQDEAGNTFDAARVETTIIEQFTPPKELSPGTVIKKSPKVHSDSDTDCYVRMLVQFTDDAQTLCEPIAVNSGWESGGDGYYYWTGILAPGEDTGTLFDEVKLRDDIDTEDIISFDILVYSEAVQAGGLTAQEAWQTVDFKQGAIN